MGSVAEKKEEHSNLDNSQQKDSSKSNVHDVGPVEEVITAPSKPHSWPEMSVNEIKKRAPKWKIRPELKPGDNEFVLWGPLGPVVFDIYGNYDVIPWADERFKADKVRLRSLPRLNFIHNQAIFIDPDGKEFLYEARLGGRIQRENYDGTDRVLIDIPNQTFGFRPYLGDFDVSFDISVLKITSDFLQEDQNQKTTQTQAHTEHPQVTTAKSLEHTPKAFEPATTSKHKRPKHSAAKRLVEPSAAHKLVEPSVMFKSMETTLCESDACILIPSAKASAEMAVITQVEISPEIVVIDQFGHTLSRPITTSREINSWDSYAAEALQRLKSMHENDGLTPTMVHAHTTADSTPESKATHTEKMEVRILDPLGRFGNVFLFNKKKTKPFFEAEPIAKSYNYKAADKEYSYSTPTPDYGATPESQPSTYENAPETEPNENYPENVESCDSSDSCDSSSSSNSSNYSSSSDSSDSTDSDADSQQSDYQEYQGEERTFEGDQENDYLMRHPEEGWYEMPDGMWAQHDGRDGFYYDADGKVWRNKWGQTSEEYIEEIKMLQEMSEADEYIRSYGKRKLPLFLLLRLRS